MNPWLLLGGSIGLEVIATNLLKLSDGFTKPLPTISALLIYALSFYLVSIVFRSLPVGLAFGQKLDMPAMLGIALIISGVLVINLFSTTNH